jgi:hypothetical protein
VLLELGLVIDVAALGIADVLLEGLDDRRTHGVEAEGHIDGADERLGEVGQDVLVGLQLGELAGSLAGPAMRRSSLPKPSRAATTRAGGAADDVGAQARQVTLGEGGKAAVQLGRDAQS